jgi:ribonuclease Z
MNPSRPLHSYMGSPVFLDAGAATLRLVNGVFGDPLLEVRVHGMRRRLLFDLGEASGLSARELHGVSDVFITHAHIDHIAGFLSLLRSRIGVPLPPCRIFGPPGVADHISGFVSGIRWDRIDDEGPIFLVGDIDEDHIAWHRIQPGKPRETIEPQAISGGRLQDEPGFTVRCIRLDHGIPVLSFAIELSGQRHIRQNQLDALGLEPGPWVGELLTHLAAGETDAPVTVAPDRQLAVRELAGHLVHESPGTRIVYATDFADTPVNRSALAAHAREADWFFCEATFRREDRRLAATTHHLTTTACGEIAVGARVKHLVPFHFSKRYIRNLAEVYGEIRASCPDTPITMAAER